MDCRIIAKVIIEKTVYRFDKPFDYLIPSLLVDYCVPGSRVTVPFGRGNCTRIGLIISTEKANETDKLKEILTVEDKKPVLSSEMLSVALWLKEHTFCNYYDAVKTILPFGINLKVEEIVTLNTEIPPETIALLSKGASEILLYIRKCKGICKKDALFDTFGISKDDPDFCELVSNNIISFDSKARQNMQDPTALMVRLISDDFTGVKLTEKQKSVVSLLNDIGTASEKEVLYFAGVTQAVINALVKKNIAETFSAPVLKYTVSSETENNEIVLTDEQQKAFEGLKAQMESGKPTAALLYGVTGSGKTSVFLRLVDEAVNSGKGAIIMVPEISLTPQTLSKFRSRYGNKVAVFHSAMSLGQRREEWKRTESGEATVAIGTRSAVFAPVKNLGIIIMDEEQEHTYKSEQSPRFHARDVAKYRCKLNNALLLLGSATPSVESYSLAKRSVYSFYTLKNRYGNAVLPRVVTVDMRRELSSGNTNIFSRQLLDSLCETLENKKQAIILLNRRGHNTYVSCPACGYVMTCPNCSISLTYHSANHRLMCHYCGASYPVLDKCPTCGNTKMRFSGAGTQKADEELTKLFPDARILRLDADTTMTRDVFDKGLTAFANGEYDIMLGTQMVAKGLDFPNVTLVGVLSADQSMYSDDFRSFERTFSLLTQVIGRSGRGNEHGVALVQTSEPDNYIIELACKQDYDSFFETEIITRKLMIYPPYCDIILVGIVADSIDTARSNANNFFEILKKRLEKSKVKMIILGPSPASVVKVNTKYRFRLIIKAKNNKELRSLLNFSLDDFYKNADKNVTLYIDINPESII